MKEKLVQYPAKLPQEIIDKLNKEADKKKASRNGLLIGILKKYYKIK